MVCLFLFVWSILTWNCSATVYSLAHSLFQIIGITNRVPFYFCSAAEVLTSVASGEHWVWVIQCKSVSVFTLTEKISNKKGYCPSLMELIQKLTSVGEAWMNFASATNANLQFLLKSAIQELKTHKQISGQIDDMRQEITQLREATQQHATTSHVENTLEAFRTEIRESIKKLKAPNTTQELSQSYAPVSKVNAANTLPSGKQKHNKKFSVLWKGRKKQKSGRSTFASGVLRNKRMMLKHSRMFVANLAWPLRSSQWPALTENHERDSKNRKIAKQTLR